MLEWQESLIISLLLYAEKHGITGEALQLFFDQFYRLLNKGK